MATLTANQLAQIRDYVSSAWGDDYNDTACQTHFDRAGSWSGAALILVRRKLAELAGQPDSITVSGEVSLSINGQMASLRKLEATLVSLAAADEDTDTDLVDVSLGMSSAEFTSVDALTR